MSTLPPCPQCHSELTCEDAGLFVFDGFGPMQLKTEFVKKI